MYTLQIINNYEYDCVFMNNQTKKDIIVNSQNNIVLNNMGNGYLQIPGIGQVNFLDLGDKKLNGYPVPKETWGVLVRTHTTEGYYRYEGGGSLELTVNNLGSCNLTTSNGTLIPIAIPELTINNQ